jgi:UDP-N-acetylglucosamine--N-acetylmuramyl-(pentapeptide) pyrophosphoryl-undecaprenol N-acetylglucosamine transferase
MHIVIAGGGTGGHVFPAVEIAKEFRRQYPDAKITIAGNQNSLEERVAANAGFPFFQANSAQLAGKPWWQQILALMRIQVAAIKSALFLLFRRPQAIIGVGGNVSVPMLVAGFFLGIKIYICEQNVAPGLANSYLATLARKIFVNFAESKNYFLARKVVVTGNPIREDFFKVADHRPHDEIKILVAGGSLGSRAINQQVPLALARLKLPQKFSVTHQTGMAMVEEVQASYNQSHVPGRATAFIDNMPEAFATHHLLISRAGATVCTEILAARMPAILIPYPHANAHQRENAQALVKIGVAVMVEEGENLAERLASAVQSLYDDPNKLKAMAQSAIGHGQPHAAAKIVEAVLGT